MKYLLFIACMLATMCSTGQTTEEPAGTPVFSYDERGTVVPNDSFIDSLENDDSLTDIEPYTLKKSRTIDDMYTVKLSKYNGWEGEAGDFNVIEILHRDNKLISLNYDDGWDFFYFNPDCNRDTINFFKEIKQNNITFLVFTGRPVMSLPPFLTIIALQSNEATLVYNKLSYINSIRTENGETIFDLQLNTVEYDWDGNPYDEPKLATLTFKDGMIYYAEEPSGKKG